MANAGFMVDGLGPKTTTNLWREMKASMTRPIEDWRFLAAFSIPGVGKGGCEKLLQHHALTDVFNLTVEDVVRIDGFAEKTATVLVETLANIKPQFDAMVDLFALLPTPRGRSVDSPIAGKTIVFTGAMQHGSRDDMQKQARALGAKVSSSVSSKTDYLICGENAGKAKLDAALKHGVTVLTEQGYLIIVKIPH